MRQTKTGQRRPYERPRMRVVELQQHAHLLQTSGERPDYAPETW